MGHPLDRAIYAERIANHAMKLAIAANRAWVQKNVNWDAEVRREFLWFRRNLREFERLHFPAKNSARSPNEVSAGKETRDEP
jgi:hypothetical protein